MAEETGTATAEVEDKVLQDKKTETHEEIHDADDTQYQHDVDEAKKEWEKEKVGPPPGSSRWNKIYYQGKEAERLGNELAEVKGTVSALRQHNDELMRVVTETKNAVDTTVKDKTANDVQTIKASIQTLKQQRREYAAANDMANAFACEDRIEELKEYLEELSKPKTEDITKKVVDTVKESEDKRTYSKFLKETPWYNPKEDKFDEAMTAYADSLWVKANKNWSGTYEDNLESVKKKVETKFKYGNGAGGKPPTLPPVEGAGGGKPPAEIKIELNDEERRVAINMFDNLSPNDAIKRYAAQKAIIANNRGAR